MSAKELKMLYHNLSHIADDLTALCALTETVKDAVEREDDHYAASVHGICVFMADIMENLDDAVSFVKGAAGV